MSGQRVYIRYSTAFRRKVVEEIESGKYSIGEAARIYDIRGGETIQNWLRKMGRKHLLNKVVRIEMKDEKDKLKALEGEKKELESALAQAHLKILSLETMLDIASEKVGQDLKKKYATKVSKGS